MHALATMRQFRILTFIIPVLALAGCGQGDGPDSIPGTAATPLPPIPPGFCDPINFEVLCPPATINNFNGGVTTIIDNPDKSGINTSDSVAQMQKYPDDPAKLFGGTGLVRGPALDFSNGTAFKIKAWSPRDVRLVFKLEAGPLGMADQGASREQEQTIGGSSAWEELCFDFAGNLPTLDVFSIILIFDNGVAGAADVDPDNWTFFYDDITQVADCGGGGGPGPGALSFPVDFEADPATYDFGMDGGFGGGASDVIANPDMSGINNSAQTARMQKFAGEVFGGSTLAFGGDIDFAGGEVFTMKVWSARAVPVLFKFEGLDKERSVSHGGGGTWEELCFDFTADTAGPASNAITFIFDLGVNGDATGDPNNWTFYFDDIQQVSSCGGGGAAASFPVDFEADPASYDFGMAGGFGGGASDVIANPDMSGINTSAQTARMQKFAGEVFGGSTLALGGDIDFAGGEVFTMKVWASRTVPVLFKFEGLNKERSVDHSGSGTWEELCFDFTADTAGPASNAITFIFDLGINGDAMGDPNNWTFYYDDIQQVASCPTGGGGGMATSVDFEDAGGPYSFSDFGGGVAQVIDNPDPSGINTTAKVAQMEKFAGEVFGGSTLALGSDIDFAEGEAFTVKVWASRAVPVLFKLEGLNKERSVTQMGGGMWEELCFDFTGDTAGPASNAITFIFDLGVAGDAAGDPNNWTFYFDDIQQVASCPTGGGGMATSVDFEGDPANFSFNDFGGGASTVIANPDMSGINTSGQVVQMQKFAGEIFGGSTLDLPSGVDFAEGEVFTMKVWSPRAVPVLFKLEGLNQERSDDHDGGGTWQELCFDFTGSTAGAPVTGITVIFDLGVNGDAAGDPNNWTFYYDEIQQQTDACPTGGGGGSVLPVDFEGDPNSYVFREGGGFGGGQASVVNNPDMNGNTSAQVGQMLKFAGEVFGGATLDLGGTVDLPANSVFTMKVWSQRAVPVLFKLEGGPVGEVSVTHGGTGWEDLCFDFGALSGNGIDGITLIFDLGVNGDAATDPTNWTFYFDDIDQADTCPSGGGGGGTVSTTVSDFEDAGGPYTFSDFGGGVATVIDNPDASGSNTSAKVGQMQKFAGEVFGGSTFQLASPVDVPAGSVFKMQVWASRQVPVLFKLEGGPVAEIAVNHTGSGSWEELTFDFTGVSGTITGITLIFDLGVAGDAAGDPNNWTFFFDGIVLESPDTGSGTIVTPVTDLEDAGGPYVFNDFGGGVITVIDNPDASGINTSAKVGQMQKFAGEVFGGSTIQLAAQVDIPAGSVFKMQVWASRQVPVLFKLEGGPVAEIAVNHSGSSSWEELTFDFTGVSGTITGITLIFDLGVAGDAAGDPNNWTFYFDGIVLESPDTGGGGGGASGELTVNGDFETGDTTGWQEFPNGGIIMVTGPGSDVGGPASAFAGNLDASGQAIGVTLKQANLAAGGLTPGQQVTVSFDWKGSDAIGGVVDVRLLSELSGGGVSQEDIILGGAGFPSNWTALGPVNITIGPDVSGGITLQFTAICGGDPGCVSSIDIDNVSVTAP